MICAMALVVLCASAAAAFVGLPVSGGQVNDDLAAGISPGLSVSGADPANADVVGGSLDPAKAAIPWASFQQEQAGGAHDQIFVRSFQSGAWSTEGAGTVGGRSSAAPTFSSSLNFDQTSDGETPSIDFAGSARAAPWAAWFEDTSGAGFAADEVFASRFDPATAHWLFGGQGRGDGGGSVPVPSLNIHTDQSAEDPVLAGGSTSAGGRPAPWVAWQETTTAPVNGKSQIFVSKALGPGMPNCNEVTPAGVPVAGNVPAVGGVCWQDVGIQRVGPAGADPSLNVDPTREAEQPDMAFTGAGDSVPWVVWYEHGQTTPAGLAENDLVFAAHAGVPSFTTPPTGTVDGGFDWEAVGSGGSGVLDSSGAPAHGPCAQSASVERSCSLNASANADASDPRVAAGTMTPGSVTVPWVAWDEVVGGVRKIFVSRLAGGRFQLANGGAPIAAGSSGDAGRPDITFSRNTPYITWREDTGGGVEKAFTGHFVNAANPTFVLDSPAGTPATPTAQADVREPISSTCTATPFNGDGSACQGGAIGTPFLLFTGGVGPRSLFAQAYQPSGVTTGAASSVGETSAVVSESLSLGGAPAAVRVEFGPTASYGSSTPDQPVGLGGVDPLPLSTSLTGLAAATTYHYRVVAITDFGLVAGADQSFVTSHPQASQPAHAAAPTVKLKLLTRRLREALKSHRLKVQVTLSGPGTVSLTASVKTLRGKVSVRSKPIPKTIAIAARKVSFSVASRRTVTLVLTKAARRLLAHTKHVRLTLAASVRNAAGAHRMASIVQTVKR